MMIIKLFIHDEIPSLATFIESLQTGTNGAVEYTNPSNGNVKASFEGALNASTLTCTDVINTIDNIRD